MKKPNANRTQTERQIRHKLSDMCIICVTERKPNANQTVKTRHFEAGFEKTERKPNANRTVKELQAERNYCKIYNRTETERKKHAILRQDLKKPNANRTLLKSNITGTGDIASILNNKHLSLISLISSSCSQSLEQIKTLSLSFLFIFYYILYYNNNSIKRIL